MTGTILDKIAAYKRQEVAAAKATVSEASLVTNTGLNRANSAPRGFLKALESKRAEFEAWQKKRDQFAQLADESLVEIYSKMRPDAAAGRLEILEPILAAAIVLKLPRRRASVILNEMTAAKAASITEVIAASSVTKEPS